MSKYSEAIIKQAEGLIEKHLPLAKEVDKFGETGWEGPPRWGKIGQDAEATRKNAIKAAIVSCEFADDYTKTDAEYQEVNQIQSYLEELL